VLLLHTTCHKLGLCYRLCRTHVLCKCVLPAQAPGRRGPCAGAAAAAMKDDICVAAEGAVGKRTLASALGAGAERGGGVDHLVASILLVEPAVELSSTGTWQVCMQHFVCPVLRDNHSTHATVLFDSPG
jgi:hypothetical protein